MPTRNVVLTDHHVRVIETLVQSGRYQNAREALREGIRLVEQREAEDAAKVAAFREAARIGFADFETGRYEEFEAAEDLASHIDEITERAVAEEIGER